jgi:hypothetical protein
MSIPVIQKNEESKIQELINQAPGSFFGMVSEGVKILPPNHYKERKDFFEKVKLHLNSELAGTGFYNIVNGSTKATRAIFTIQKGTPAEIKTLPEMDRSADFALVKENAELKAELAYLKIRLDELTAQLEEQEADLAEGEELKEEAKPNPWANLAEQLIPVAGQLAAAIATKFLTPQPNGSAGTQQKPMETGNPRTNVTTPTPAVQYRYPNSTGHLQGNDYPGTDFRNINSETIQEE